MFSCYQFSLKSFEQFIKYHVDVQGRFLQKIINVCSVHAYMILFCVIQPKIQLCSKYERHTDHRTYVERKDLFEELAKDPPPPEITRVGGGGEEGEGGEGEEEE